MRDWIIHIEGSGICEDGKPGNVDELLREFVGKLGQVNSAVLAVGSDRDPESPPLPDLVAPTLYRIR